MNSDTPLFLALLASVVLVGLSSAAFHALGGWAMVATFLVSLVVSAIVARLISRRAGG